MKRLTKYLVMALMIFANILNAQPVLTIQGNVSDLNGSAISNQDVYFSDDTTGFNFGMAITDINGDYSGVFTPSSNPTGVGIIFVATEDCNFNMVLNTHPYTPNVTTITSDFTICTTCNLTGVSVVVDSNTNMMEATWDPNYYYWWDNGDSTQATAYYPNWCIYVYDVNTGCDTVFCDPNGQSFCYADFYSTQVNASDTTFFFNMSSGTTTSTSYFWDFGDGATSIDENPRHLYTTSGWYYVCLTIVDSSTNCYDTYCDYINIIVGSSSSCQAYFYGNAAWIPNTYEFYDYSLGNITNWTWNFGDGTTSILQNPTHTYTSSGLYLVCLTIEEIDPATGIFICSDTFCDSIYLFNQQTCMADFYGQNIGNNEAIFSNLSYPQTGPVGGGFSEVEIDYGDGIIDFNIGGTINHTYSTAGTYYVCVTVTEADQSGTVICTDTYCDSVTVASGAAPCIADFNYYQDTALIIWNPNGGTWVIDSSTFMFYDISIPIGLVNSWQWDMGDNGAGTFMQGTLSASQHPIYQFDTTGTYIVCLTIITANGCTDDYCDTVFFYMNQGPPSAVNDRALEIVNIYPNPAIDNINITLSTKSIAEVKVDIINIMGQIVTTKNTSSSNVMIDVSNLSSGIYSVKVIQNEAVQYKKVIID